MKKPILWDGYWIGLFAGWFAVTMALLAYASWTEPGHSWGYAVLFLVAGIVSLWTGYWSLKLLFGAIFHTKDAIKGELERMKYTKERLLGGIISREYKITKVNERMKILRELAGISESPTTDKRDYEPYHIGQWDNDWADSKRRNSP